MNAYWGPVGTLPALSRLASNAIGAGDQLGKLAIQRVGNIDIGSLAGMGDQQAAALRVLAGVGGLGQRGVGGVPGVEEGVAALLDPAVKVGGGDGVGRGEQGIGRIEQLDGRLLVDDALRRSGPSRAGTGRGSCRSGTGRSACRRGGQIH